MIRSLCSKPIGSALIVMKIAAIAREKERVAAWRRQEIVALSESLLQRLYQPIALELLYMKFFAGPTAAGREALRKAVDSISRYKPAPVPKLAFRYSSTRREGRIAAKSAVTPPPSIFRKSLRAAGGGTTPLFS